MRGQGRKNGQVPIGRKIKGKGSYIHSVPSPTGNRQDVQHRCCAQVDGILANWSGRLCPTVGDKLDRLPATL